MSRNPRRRPGLELLPMADGFVVRGPRDREATWLNATAALVLHLCTGRSSVALIAAAVREAYDVSAPVESEIKECLTQLTVAGLVDLDPGAAAGDVLVSIVSPSGQVAAGTMATLREWQAPEQWGGRQVEVTVATGPEHFAHNRAATRVVTEERFAHLLLLGAEVTLSVAEGQRLLTSPFDVVALPQAVHRQRWQQVREATQRVPDLSVEDIAATAAAFAVTVVRGADGHQVRDGFLRCDAVDLSALLVSRAALHRMTTTGVAARYHRQVTTGYADDGAGWGFFDPALTPNGEAIDAATAFCARWRASGGEVWVDLSGEFGQSLAIAGRVVRARR